MRKIEIIRLRRWKRNGRKNFKNDIMLFLKKMIEEKWDYQSTVNIIEEYLYGRSLEEVHRVYETRIDCCTVREGVPLLKGK